MVTDRRLRRKVWKVVLLAMFTCWSLAYANPDSWDESSSTLNQRNTECFYTYSENDQYQSFTEWLHRKNATHYSPIVPSDQQALRIIEVQTLEDGMQMTSSGADCSSRQIGRMGSDTPLRERALCNFEYKLNYNSKRIPAALAEVECVCQRPSRRLTGNRLFECEPLRYQVRVLLFDEACHSFVATTETIVLACLPVVTVNAIAEGDFEVIQPMKADIEV